MPRNAQNQANNAVNQAASTSANLGAQAQGIASNEVPFLTQEMLHPQGYGQQGTGAMEAAALGGAGGANSGLVGQATQRAAASRNAGGYQAALDDAARSQEKAAAGASEGIAAQNADLEQQQSQEGAAGLGNMYKTDTSGMLQSASQEAPDINAETNAGNSGWLQSTMGILGGLGAAAGGAGGLMTGYFGNQGMKNGCWIAAELYGGWDDPRTIAVRQWIFGEFGKSKIGSVVCKVYLRFGGRIAAAIHAYPILRKPFKALFDCALRRSK